MRAYHSGGTVMFRRNANELAKPPLAREKGAVEILRVWGGENLPQQCSLRTTWSDPGVWGMLLVDVAKHAAKAYAQSGSTSERDALKRIMDLFDAEWESPTDEPQQLS